jgi:hypothetical protein
MTRRPLNPFIIPTEQLDKILLSDTFELLDNGVRIERLDQVKAWNPAWLAEAEFKLKWAAIQGYFRPKDGEELPDFISTERELPNGKKVRGYIKTTNATLKDLMFSESDFFKRGNACLKRSMQLREQAYEVYGVQIGLPYELEARTTEFRRSKKAQRHEQSQPATPSKQRHLRETKGDK